MSGGLVVVLVVLAAAVSALLVMVIRTRLVVATPTERAVHFTLHTASLAARSLRGGLSTEGAADALPPLLQLTAADGVAIYDASANLLAHSGNSNDENSQVWTDELLAAAADAAGRAADEGRRILVTDPADVSLGPQPPMRALIAQPLIVDDAGAGVLIAATTARPGPGMLAAIAEVARYVSSQLELADLDASRARLDRAEVLALRAQISPHFIYNALNTIGSFVRTDPDRARNLIIEFADFTRYSFRAAGEYTLLSDELHNIDRYLTLERARFGDSLTIRLHVAPEVLGVVLPFLALQPLVENAVRHGLAATGGGTVTITARDEGSDCIITVEDDGVGMDPDMLRSGAVDALSTTSEGAHVGLTNVDHRLRAAFGNDYGLVVDTAVGAGTKVGMRVPKFRAGIRAEAHGTATHATGRRA